MKNKYENALIHETSPYLLQHARNPVSWMPWNKETLQKARSENKLILVSIGYAACHWCHVMEKESFEDPEVAEIMNTHFINIKVDREERPDVDQIYMDAVQIMTGSGGWPLNVVTLPDGRPFWGGTYFKKEHWKSYLTQLATLFRDDPEKVEEYAQNLKKGIQGLHTIPAIEKEREFLEKDLQKAINDWEPYFDLKYGGPTRAPKFMMPANYQFFLKYAYTTGDKELFNYVNTTLTKIAYGGVFDHIGGGFARYSVDSKWHVPHFEKMLYDNGQLVSLYSDAFKVTGNPLYLSVVTQTLEFTERELLSDEFGFYSSLDADSPNKEGESEEGAFYVWDEKELKDLLKNDFPVFRDYFNINHFGLWEHGNYVLIRTETEAEIALKHNLVSEEVNTVITRCRQLLFKERSKRIPPGLDDKILTSWNALMLKGYADAYKAIGNEHYLNIAQKNAHFLTAKLMRPDGGLFHSYKNGQGKINGYLEDYALLADALITLYEITLNETWLEISKQLIEYCKVHFYDASKGIFYFTSNEDDPIVTRSIEKSDNVIPASNSVIHRVLFRLSRLLGDASYGSIAQKMMQGMFSEVTEYPYSHANWLNGLMDYVFPFKEVAITGPDAIQLTKTLNSEYLPGIVIAGTTSPSSVFLLKERFVKDENLIYICTNNTCTLPVHSVEEALEQLKSKNAL
ncbi:thioredoxin domain-containing protein [Ascidiimonas aurantiaca]|uniref:thioredoxin domain-containing protein n=1 Tax=Ascidiimonas aurantiaca TaxID=1685432 RepID=UPI0030EF5B00